MDQATPTTAAVETLKELDRRGYWLSVRIKMVVHDHKVGAHAISYGDQLLVSGGPGPLDDALRAAVKLHQPYLLAAACVRMPPVTWLEVLVSKYRLGKVPARTLAANLAAFLGKSPVQDGPELEPIIEEAF